MGQQSSRPSVVEVYAQWVLKYPELAQKSILVSRAPETEFSTVDVSIYVPLDLKDCLEHCKTSGYNADITDRTAAGYFTVKFADFDRPVIVIFTCDEILIRRTLQCRINELHMCTRWPDLADSVRKIRSVPGGESAEKAWVQVLGVSEDPCDYMAGPFDTIFAAGLNVTKGTSGGKGV